MMIKRLRMLDMERTKITDYTLPAWPDIVWPFFFRIFTVMILTLSLFLAEPYVMVAILAAELQSLSTAVCMKNTESEINQRL